MERLRARESHSVLNVEHGIRVSCRIRDAVDDERRQVDLTRRVVHAAVRGRVERHGGVVANNYVLQFASRGTNFYAAVDNGERLDACDVAVQREVIVANSEVRWACELAERCSGQAKAEYH